MHILYDILNLLLANYKMAKHCTYNLSQSIWICTNRSAAHHLLTPPPRVIYNEWSLSSHTRTWKVRDEEGGCTLCGDKHILCSTHALTSPNTHHHSNNIGVPFNNGSSSIGGRSPPIISPVKMIVLVSGRRKHLCVFIVRITYILNDDIRVTKSLSLKWIRRIRTYLL